MFQTVLTGVLKVVHTIFTRLHQQHHPHHYHHHHHQQNHHQQHHHHHHHHLHHLQNHDDDHQDHGLTDGGETSLHDKFITGSAPHWADTINPISLSVSCIKSCKMSNVLLRSNLSNQNWHRYIHLTELILWILFLSLIIIIFTSSAELILWILFLSV